MIENTLMNPLGQLLKKVRANNAWSQEQFAEISGISTRALQRIEGGEKANMETLRAIAAALNMEVTTLLPVNTLMGEEEFAKVQAQADDQAQKELAQLEKELNVLPRMRNGKELLTAVASVQALNTDHPHPVSEEEASTIADLLGLVRDYADIHNDLEPQQQMEIILDATRRLEELERSGLVVFAGRLRGHIVFPAPSSDVPPLRIRQAGVFICRTSEVKTITDEQGREAFRFRIPYGPVSF
jgi:transcriptional regulator with XRE-family HTH domain